MNIKIFPENNFFNFARISCIALFSVMLLSCTRQRLSYEDDLIKIKNTSELKSIRIVGKVSCATLTDITKVGDYSLTTAILNVADNRDYPVRIIATAVVDGPNINIENTQCLDNQKGEWQDLGESMVFVTGYVINTSVELTPSVGQQLQLSDEQKNFIDLLNAESIIATEISVFNPDGTPLVGGGGKYKLTNSYLSGPNDRIVCTSSDSESPCDISKIPPIVYFVTFQLAPYPK